MRERPLGLPPTPGPAEKKGGRSWGPAAPGFKGGDENAGKQQKAAPTASAGLRGARKRGSRPRLPGREAAGPRLALPRAAPAGAPGLPRAFPAWLRVPPPPGAPGLGGRGSFPVPPLAAAAGD